MLHDCISLGPLRLYSPLCHISPESSYGTTIEKTLTTTSASSKRRPHLVMIIFALRSIHCLDSHRINSGGSRSRSGFPLSYRYSLELGLSEHKYLATNRCSDDMISITGLLKFWRCPTNDTQACFASFRFKLASPPHSECWSMRQIFAMLYFVDQHAGKDDAEGPVNSSHIHSPRTYARCDLSYLGD